MQTWLFSLPEEQLGLTAYPLSISPRALRYLPLPGEQHSTQQNPGSLLSRVLHSPRFLRLCTFAPLVPLPNLPSLFSPLYSLAAWQASTHPWKPISGLSSSVIHLWSPSVGSFQLSPFPLYIPCAFVITLFLPLMMVSVCLSVLTELTVYRVLFMLMSPVPGTVSGI